jgi:phage/plasmid primase-like uncharacterized protein
MHRDDWIDQAHVTKIETVLCDRQIKLRGRNGKLAGPCPCCGGYDRFAVNFNKGFGVFHCRGCGGKGGDAISLIQFLDGCDFLAAVEALAGPPPDCKGETDEQRGERERRAVERRERIARERIEREAREAAELRETLRYCDVLWREAVPLPPQAIAYFVARMIDINAMPDQAGLRFHAQCPFDGEIKPCIVARFTDPLTNEPRGIWRRPITGEKPKSIGPVSGHVIRLWPDEYVERGLVIGEGVETVLAAAREITHRATQLAPAWACGCADTLKNFPVLPGIEFLTILADNDAKGAGQGAAHVCAERWADAGREVEVLTPDAIGSDFNDLVLRSAS